MTTKVKEVRTLSEGVTGLNTLQAKIKSIKKLKPNMVLVHASYAQTVNIMLREYAKQAGVGQSPLPPHAGVVARRSGSNMLTT